MKNNPTSDTRLELLFRHAGLSEKQAKLYRLLLSSGEEKAGTLTKKSGMKRGNVYALLDDLVARGLVTEKTNGKVTSYLPEPPNRLLSIIEAREKEVKVAKELAVDLVPSLTTQWKSAINRPTISLFEGKEGMAKVFEDIYGPKGNDNTVWGCADIERVHIEFPETLHKKLIPMRLKNNWIARSIFTDNKGGIALQADDEQHKRISYVVNGESYPLPAEIDVYDDKITMLCFEKGEFIGLIVENKAFAQTLRSIFTLAFEHSKSLNKNKPHAEIPVQA